MKEAVLVGVGSLLMFGMIALMTWGTSHLSLCGPQSEWYQHQCSANPLR